MKKNILFYSLLVIFVISALIALGGITKLIDIEEGYLGPLFTAVILEVIGCIIYFARTSNIMEEPKKEDNINHNAIVQPSQKDNTLSEVLVSEIESEESKEEKNYLASMLIAFEEDRSDEAKRIFEQWRDEENDIEMQEKIEALFLSESYTKIYDDSALEKLKELARNSEYEEVKYYVLLCLSVCFWHCGQIEKVISLWQDSFGEFKNDEYITDAIVELSKAFNENGETDKAKSILVNRFRETISDEEGGLIFRALSDVEKSLNNQVMSVYCKDKYAEFFPTDSDNLFSVAYQAGEAGITHLQIANYQLLLKMDPKSGSALNNVGVIASKKGYNIIAIEKYKEAAKYNETLAMSNQGHALLDAGFIEEAESVAKKAMALEDVHENIHGLLSKIPQRKQQQNREWSNFTDEGSKFQKIIRQYTAAYYQNYSDFNGEWKTESGELVNITHTDDRIQCSWLAHKDEESIEGTVSGASCMVQYRKERKNGRRLSSLYDKSIKCFGFLSENNDKLDLFSENTEDNFKLSFTRVMI